MPLSDFLLWLDFESPPNEIDYQPDKQSAKAMLTPAEHWSIVAGYIYEEIPSSVQQGRSYPRSLALYHIHFEGSDTRKDIPDKEEQDRMSNMEHASISAAYNARRYKLLLDYNPGDLDDSKRLIPKSL